MRQLLRDQSLLPVAVSEVQEQETARRAPAASASASERGLSAADLALVTRQLATLVKSALPLEEALLAVSQQTDKPRVRSIMLGVRSRVMEGHALARRPRGLPGLVSRRSIARRSRPASNPATSTPCSSGWPTTPTTASSCAAAPLAALLYPVLLFVVCVAIVFFLLVSVVPKIVDVFRNSNAELPLLTQVLIATSDFMRAYGHLPVHRDRRGAVPASRVRCASSPTAAAGIASCSGLPLIGKVVRARQHRALRAHAEHAHREHGAGARGAADLRARS